MQNISFDTNAYREVAEILKHKSEEEKNAFIERFLACEKDKGYNHVFNPFVILELLQHLVDSKDEAYSICKEAILFIGKYTLKGALLPLLDDYLARMLFNAPIKNSVAIQRMKDLPFVLEKIIQNGGSDSVIDKLKPQLIILTDLLNDYKQMLIENIKKTSYDLKHNRDGIKNVSSNRGKFKDKFILAVAESTLKHISGYLGINYESMNSEEKQYKINLLTENFLFPFEMIRLFNRKMLDPNFKFEKKEHVNDILDIAMTHYINLVNNYMYVTNENKSISEAVKELSLGCQVLSLVEYLKKIDFYPP